MGVCGCVIPSPDCHCHFTPVSDWQYNNSTNHLVTMPKSVLDQIGKEHTEEIERLRQQNAELNQKIKDLVESLEWIANRLESNHTVPSEAILARNAIAKATGGE